MASWCNQRGSFERGGEEKKENISHAKQPPITETETKADFKMALKGHKDSWEPLENSSFE